MLVIGAKFVFGEPSVFNKVTQCVGGEKPKLFVGGASCVGEGSCMH